MGYTAGVCVEASLFSDVQFGSCVGVAYVIAE